MERPGDGLARLCRVLQARVKCGIYYKYNEKSLGEFKQVEYTMNCSYENNS